MSYNNNRGGYRRADSANSNRSGGHRRGNSRRMDTSNLPVEQGIICSLKESFGFIHCAERPEQVFFHYSEVTNSHPDDLQIDTEVEFKLGQSEKDPTKRSAYAVHTVPTGTVVWETEEEPDKLVTGVVDRAIRTDSRGGRGNSNNVANSEGSIQVRAEEEDEKEKTDKSSGPLVRFRAGDLDSESSKSNRLFRGDLVQFRIFLDRRTKQRYARQIVLLKTEKELAREEREKRLLEGASEEEGVVISLNKGFGFLKSNKRHAHVYFHFSNLDLPENFELEKGQAMKFLVVTDVVDGLNKCSARQLELLPNGSVIFHTVVAKGIKGIVTLCPQPPSAGGNSGYADDKDGSITLMDPLVDKDGEEEISITNVSFEFNDAPGGVYTFQQRGAAANGLWILEGDVLLFDVVKELADGSYQAAPTCHTLGLGGKVVEPPADADENKAAIRLSACSLVSRAEGTMHTLKVAGGYGFIHFAERPIDVHFHTYNLMPEELQADLRMEMGIDAKEVNLEVGVGVQFDICTHGTVHSGAGRGGAGGGRKRGNAHERENVKAHRVLLLPSSVVSMEKTLAQGVKGVVKTSDSKQLYAGFVDLDQEFEALSVKERHPLVAKMIESFLEESSKPSGRTSLVYRDILSAKDDEVVAGLVKEIGGGVLNCTHIRVAGLDGPGRICIRRNAEPTEAEPEEPTAPKKKQQQTKPNQNLRFDKSSLIEELKEELPPSVGDLVVCDVVQSRRTGKLIVHNLIITQRTEQSFEVAKDDASGPAAASGVGVVQNVIPKSNFGFISVLDENASRQELLAFSLPGDKQTRMGLAFRKGDEVKFDFGVDKKTGKRMAMNVQMVAKGTIPSKPSHNACRGLVLMEPTHTSLSNAPQRKKQSGGDGGRWGNLKQDSGKVQRDLQEQGVILLLEDKTNMFSGGARRNRRRKMSSGSEDEMSTDGTRSLDDGSVGSFDDRSTDDERSVGSMSSYEEDDLEPAGGILSHLAYKTGALALHGAGSSGTMNTSTNPRRGDLVSFVKARKSVKGVREIRVEDRQAATMLRGRLENIEIHESVELRKPSGKAKFIAATEKEEVYEVNLAEVVSCDVKLLKEKQQVEGILHDGRIFGICRTSDLYLGSKLGTSHKERPKLNLSVKKNRGGKIIAQSMMAKGPDGTVGFAAGWTTRTSKFAAFGT